MAKHQGSFKGNTLKVRTASKSVARVGHKLNHPVRVKKGGRV